MVFRSIPIDVMYICAELVTGKSIPVLVGITRLPVDQFLAWLMLLLGAVFGTLFSVYTSRAVTGMTLLGFSNRLIQLCFSLCMSLSMLLSVSTGIQASSGFVLSLIPAFCVVAQNLPQRDSTALLSFGLCSLLFYVAMITSVMAEKREVDSMALTMMMHHDRGLVGPGRKSVARETEGVWRYVWRSLQLFLLGFYACIQHAPTQVLYRVFRVLSCLKLDFCLFLAGLLCHALPPLQACLLRLAPSRHPWALQSLCGATLCLDPGLRVVERVLFPGQQPACHPRKRPFQGRVGLGLLLWLHDLPALFCLLDGYANQGTSPPALQHRVCLC